jgi:ribosomal protein S18 acetylase RimI-like enzyme
MTDPAPNITIRPATPEDADALAQFINFAGEGMPLYLWERMAEEGETSWDVGRRRARREEGGFSYLNATIAEIDGKVAACLIGYPIPGTPETIDYETMPPMFVPLQELENLSPGSWYVNVLAAYPEYRGKGLGTRLLEVAQERAAQAQCKELSIIVSDANIGARRLYERCGYSERAAREMVKDDWVNEGRNWVLLVK